MRERAGERAYRVLRGEIIDGELAPGTVLGEVEQADRLGISRTPVREALGRLVADGLLVQRPKGVEVSTVSPEGIAELYEVRLALESHAARLAARNRDPAPFERLLEQFQEVPDWLTSGDPRRRRYYELVDRLDESIDEAAGNPYLVATMRTVRTHSARVRHMARSNIPRLLAAASEHALIVQAIIDGDADLAAHATHVHLHRSLTSRLQTPRTRFVAAPETATTQAPEPRATPVSESAAPSVSESFGATSSSGEAPVPHELASDPHPPTRHASRETGDIRENA